MSDEYLDPQTRAVLAHLDRLHPIKDDEDDDEPEFDSGKIAPSSLTSQAPVAPIETVPSPAPQNPEPEAAEEKRRRGAQPGNINALRHGFYARNLGMMSPSQYSEKEMRNLLGEAAMLKDYMFILYNKNIESTDSAVLSETLRALSMAGISLARVLMVYDHIRLLSDHSNNDVPLSTLLKELDTATHAVNKLHP